MKRCTKCNKLKPLDSFYKNKMAKDGKCQRCKECVKVTVKEYYKTRNGIVTSIYNKQKENSKIREHPKPLYTKKQLRLWLFSQENFEILYNNWINSGYNKWFKPSCDRLNDYKPYSLDNIRLVTWKDNLEKHSNDRIKGINNKNNKTVLQFDKQYNLIAEYHSLTHAYRKTGIQRSNIGRVCNKSKSNKSAGGYIWKFKI